MTARTTERGASTARRVATELVAWLAAVVGWVVVSRNHHPTWLVDVLATVLLVGASAAAFYANDLVLRPRLGRRGAWPRYGLALAAVVAALDVVTVVAIQLIYDALWGPDPARYGLGTNLAYEAIFIVVHLAVATAIAAAARRVPGRSRA